MRMSHVILGLVSARYGFMLWANFPKPKGTTVKLQGFRNFCKGPVPSPGQTQSFERVPRPEILLYTIRLRILVVPEKIRCYAKSKPIKTRAKVRSDRCA